jgi:hypothetical protein
MERDSTSATFFLLALAACAASNSRFLFSSLLCFAASLVAWSATFLEALASSVSLSCTHTTQRQCMDKILAFKHITYL